MHTTEPACKQDGLKKDRGISLILSERLWISDNPSIHRTYSIRLLYEFMKCLERVCHFVWVKGSEDAGPKVQGRSVNRSLHVGKLSPLRPLAGYGDQTPLTVHRSPPAPITSSGFTSSSHVHRYSLPADGTDEEAEEAQENMDISTVSTTRSASPIRARRSTAGGISHGEEGADPVTDFGLEIQRQILRFLPFTSLHHISYAEMSKRRKEGLYGSARLIVTDNVWVDASIVPISQAIYLPFFNAVLSFMAPTHPTSN
ncbi:hypothetical protein EV359DRAFT_69032 [Lentinula novae-zelandiae]|nr:hypothetical protein EV359DRAFT_69032 [Lentinula novae-zelandiae]